MAYKEIREYICCNDGNQMQWTVSQNNSNDLSRCQYNTWRMTHVLETKWMNYYSIKEVEKYSL